jgi:outer membrane immunogenic protein
MRRSIGFVFVGMVALAGDAQSADVFMPAPVGYKDAPCCAPAWNGFYIGVNGGYALGDAHNVTVTNNGIPFGAFTAEKPLGGFGGGQIGYNWQGSVPPHIVLGFEADLQDAGIQAQQQSTNVILGLSQLKTNIDWFGTVRGRLGYTFEQTLFYATGGFAYGNVNTRIGSLQGLGQFFARNDTGTGFVLGGGVEYKIYPRWSLKTEYQYIDLGSQNIAQAGSLIGSTARTKEVDTNLHTVRVGLNYQIQPTYEPLK